MIDRRIEAGTLIISAASIQHAARKAGRFDISLKDRSGKVEPHLFDAVIATTGPGHSGILEGQPFLAGLVKDVLVMPDLTG